MPIEFDCRVCGRRLRTPDGTEGKEAKCPACETVQTIPGAAAPEGPAAAMPGHAPGASPPFPSSGSEAAGSAGVGPSAVPPPPPPPGAPGSYPYESLSGPGVAPPGEMPPAVWAPSRIDAGDVLNRAWAIFKVHWAMVILVVIAAGAISMVINYGSTIGLAVLSAVGVDQLVVQILQVITTLIVQLVSLWLGLGVRIFLIRTARGEPASFGQLFAGGPYVLSVLLATLLLGFGAMVLMAVFFLPGLILMAAVGPEEPAAVIAFGGGMLLAFPLFIFLAVSFSQYQYLAVDRHAGPIESLLLSWQITRGNRLSMVLVYLVTMAINLLGLLACCVGMIATAPFASLIGAVMYLMLTGQPTSDQQWHTAPPGYAPGPPPEQNIPPTPPPM